MDDPANLGPATERAVEAMLGTGCYASRDDVLRAGIEALRKIGPGEVVDLDELDPETRAALAVGIAQADRDELIPAAEVFDELERRYAEWK